MGKPAIKNCIFLGNSAKVYGNDFASSFARLLPNFDLSRMSNYKIVLLGDTLTILTVDAYDQVMPYNSTFSRKVMNKKTNCGYNLPKLFGVEVINLIKGFANFSDFGASCIPGGVLHIEFYTSFYLPTDLEGGGTYQKFNQPLEIDFRNCFRGTFTGTALFFFFF